MTPQKFGALRPKGGAVIEAQMPHSFQWEFQPKHILPHNYGLLHRTFINLMSTCLGDSADSDGIGHASVRLQFHFAILQKIENLF